MPSNTHLTTRVSSVPSPCSSVNSCLPVARGNTDRRNLNLNSDREYCVRLFADNFWSKGAATRNLLFIGYGVVLLLLSVRKPFQLGGPMPTLASQHRSPRECSCRPPCSKRVLRLLPSLPILVAFCHAAKGPPPPLSWSGP